MKEGRLVVPYSGLSQLSIMATVQQLEEKFLSNKRHLDFSTDPLRETNESLRFKVLMSHG